MAGTCSEVVREEFRWKPPPRVAGVVEVDLAVDLAVVKRASVRAGLATAAAAEEEEEEEKKVVVEETAVIQTEVTMERSENRGEKVLVEKAE